MMRRSLLLAAMASLLLPSAGLAGAISISATEPTVDLDNLNELDADNNSTDTVRPLQRTGANNRAIGQSFNLATTKTLESIVLLADSSETFDASTHELQLAIFKQTTPDGDMDQLTDPGGDTQVGSTEVFDLANLSWGEDTYLTLTLDTAVELLGGVEHHFELWFTSDDSSHNINFDRSQNTGSIVATDGVLVVSQISAGGAVNTFPIGDGIVIDGGGGNRDLDYGFNFSPIPEPASVVLAAALAILIPTTRGRS
ncbi:hypothetical protein MalM25_17330 [Planctomycetes bacterium MalM25]|nr:hypothetical protein MalM25_17330 [Planctomycetes bacterium MalM25]